eukprot:TRINITY_DN1502_c0_g2_i2.p1 TRINITY_DN1502_c0_g2~~TRINITY_DN1502_c0_g2_i2.p1  ORF type:complete len:163 (+),score=19.58 TRINITY_DN1502_c0_g2_i2:148-636(+)
MAEEPKVDLKQYIFNYPWETVVKSLWEKYPHKELDFVKFSRVIDLQVLDDKSLVIRKLMYCKKFMMMWAYSVEEIRLDARNRICEMRTELLKKSKCVPDLTGSESIIYRAHGDLMDKTLYLKALRSTSNLFGKFLEKFNGSYEKGCRIIEAKCQERTMNLLP